MRETDFMQFPMELWDSDRERLAVLAAAVEAPSKPMLVLDAIGNVVFVNDAAEGLWKEPAAALVNRAAVSLLGLDTRRREADAFGRSFEGGGSWEGMAYPRRSDSNRRLTGRPAHLEPIVLRDKQKRVQVVGAVVRLDPRTRAKGKGTARSA
jgi:PAS domain-containing protein